jgi:hypothetical protein
MIALGLIKPADVVCEQVPQSERGGTIACTVIVLLSLSVPVTPDRKSDQSPFDPGHEECAERLARNPREGANAQ